MKSGKKLLRSGLLALSLLAVAVPAAFAQTPETDTTAPVERAQGQVDRNVDWGWLGLLGLIGLAGLAGRNRDREVRDVNRARP